MKTRSVTSLTVVEKNEWIRRQSEWKFLKQATLVSPVKRTLEQGKSLPLWECLKAKDMMNYKIFFITNILNVRIRALVKDLMDNTKKGTSNEI